MSEEKKGQSWFRWALGSLIAVVGAGTGLVAVLSYYDSKQAEAEREFQERLAEWQVFEPDSLSRQAQTVELSGLDRLDLETGRATGVPKSGLKWDLLFVCGPQGNEAIRAASGVQWHHLGKVSFSDVTYRDIRDAEFQSNRNPETGYNDMFYAHRGNVPGEGYAFAIKTSDNNVAKVQIMEYRSLQGNPQACRYVTLRYEVFPIVVDPPRPQRR
ncbi:MAG: hypothetical protein OEU36_17475 [Gammaproteobacteria bacterium]|nr:hypothetical protein [Gammaproteobacteria bacterium]